MRWVKIASKRQTSLPRGVAYGRPVRHAHKQNPIQRVISARPGYRNRKSTTKSVPQIKYAMLSEEELLDLPEDINNNGLHSPIVLFEGRILDGRNRYTACGLIGCEPKLEEYGGSDPLAYVVSLNLKRRHLDPSQRAMVAARLETLRHGERADYSRDANLHVCNRETAAETLNVSTRSVASAAKVQAQGVPELTAAVDNGVIAVSQAAKIANLTEEDQRKTTAQLICSSASNEWYTPAPYIESARKVMGGIDLDPASCEFANRTVQVEKFFTKEDDGLKQEWFGRVWLNPPYGGLASDFIEKLAEEYDAGTVTKAVVLVNANSAGTKWFQPLWDHTLCFTNHRVGFYNEAVSTGGSTHSNIFIYLGPNRDSFASEFEKFGAIVERKIVHREVEVTQ
jgi:ParB family transcriptional regulator, chromosome partitioning protein